MSYCFVLLKLFIGCGMADNCTETPNTPICVNDDSQDDGFKCYRKLPGNQSNFRSCIGFNNEQIVSIKILFYLDKPLFQNNYQNVCS